MTPTIGLGFKPRYFEDAITRPVVGQWYEVHPENYMAAGGPRPAMLAALRERFPVSLHGVGLSLASDGPPCASHLARLKGMVDRYQPVLVSEHLAWNRQDGWCFPDLLPVPRNREALSRLIANVGRTQDALGRTILIENPAHYMTLEGHEIPEPEFLVALCRSSGCGLLIDINNVHVGAGNLGLDPEIWLDGIPGDLVGEIHLAGHLVETHPSRTLLVDTHGESVADPVWRSYERFVGRIGPRPTLIERDENLPPFEALMMERERAAGICAAHAPRRPPPCPA